MTTEEVPPHILMTRQKLPLINTDQSKLYNHLYFLRTFTRHSQIYYMDQCITK